jgi:hypothetical protein
MKIKQIGQLAFAGALLFTASGCAGNNLGALGDILGGVLGPAAGGAAGQQTSQVRVEVQSVDSRQQAIHVRTDQGQTGAVLFDQNTVVVFQQQQYPVTALERGDIAVMQVQQLDQNRIYTSRIDVEQSVQQRSGQTGAAGQLRQISGRVSRIDHQTGIFEMQTQQGTFTVVVPNNAGQANLQYFHGLRNGANVSVEGTLNGATRIDLYRFL